MAELTIQERTAWLHRSAVKLKATDLTELKFSIKSLVAEASMLLDQINVALDEERKRNWQRINEANNA